jgi:hypothetical protein
LPKPRRKFDFKKSKLEYHFYATNGSITSTNVDVDKLTTKMKNEGFSFTLWCVPHNIKTKYNLRNYTPIIEGAVYFGYYELKQQIGSE